MRVSLVALLVLVAEMTPMPAFLAQTTPALTPDAGHAVSTSRGSSAKSFMIASKILNERRRIYVVLPASFAKSAPSRKYPVTIVLDGEDNMPPVAAVSDELIRNGQVPDMVIVAITNIDSYDGRVRDLTPPGLSVSGSDLNQGGDRFLDFIEQELLPAVDRQFRGGLPRTFIGHSSGGILATWVAATRPAFRAEVAIDTPTEFGDDFLAKKLMERATASPGALRYASYEAVYGWTDQSWGRLTAAAPASWHMHREHLDRESHESIGMLSMYLGLREVFRDYSILSAPKMPTTSILPYYEKVSASLGATVLPPRKLLRQVAEDLLMEGRGAAARAAYEALVSGYGAPPDAVRLAANIAKVEKEPPPTETVEGLLAMPAATPAEMGPYLGEWVGDTWMGAGEPRHGDQLLRIKVVDGRVVGESVTRMPGGKELVQAWTYMRVTANGLTWGYMNGMRPRAMLLHEGTRTGETLAGTLRFGGVNFRMDDGTMPPTISFAFKRVRSG